MILTCEQMKALEERAFADGISAEALMDEAGTQMSLAVQQFFPKPGLCVAVFGKGHNGGDALVAARHLAEAGWETHLVPAFPISTWAALTRRKFDEAGRCHQHAPGGDAIWSRLQQPWQNGSGPVVILDGLLGIGATGELREPIVGLCTQINTARHTANAQVFALDIPTGLNGDSGAADPNCITADFTLTVGAVKAGLLADPATEWVGRLAVLPLRELSARMNGNGARDAVADPATLAALLPRRRFDSHKGNYGRIAIVAGSAGMLGAAVMTSAACIHAGAGLVTLYVQPEIYPLVAPMVTPEVMVRSVDDYRELLEGNHDVFALGPGIGQERVVEVLDVIRRATQPMVVDADGLNILATDLGALFHAAGPRLLTPHPGEMARLMPDVIGHSRAQTVHHWLEQHPGTLLLKGARTLIGERRLPLVYNTTGNPGMGTGGMGDVLTGVLAALCGHGLKVYEAAQVGAWICGRAAELAVSHGGESHESLTARHVIERLGGAFRDLRMRVY
jgi:NAD(P)H-hydrate epimerase